MFVCPECGEGYAGPGVCARDGAALGDGSQEPLLGAMVGPYRVACRIGAGGMGQVFKGVHPTIGSRVAIKVLSGDYSRSASVVERFFAEARAVNLIRHESIVNVLDLAWLPDGRPYIVMEFLDGAPLSGVMRQRGPLPFGALVSLASEVLDALAAAHDKGIVHRDLKPDNVYVTRGGRAKVLDFGIAKLRPELNQMQGATETGSILGTPQYMSPEQALGRPVDLRADIYALGVVLFEGVTGRLPFLGTTLFEYLKQHIESPPPAPRSFRHDLPPALEQIILRALEKDPARRFGSARELQAALSAVAEHLPRESFGSLGGAPGASVPSGHLTPGVPSSSSLDGGSYYGATGAGSYPGTGLPTHAGLTHSAKAKPRGSSWLFIAAGAGALLLAAGLGVVLVGAVAVGVLRGGKSQGGARGGSPDTGGATTHDGRAREPGPGEPIEWVGQKPPGFDGEHLDVTKQFAHGEGFARRSLPDLELVRIDIAGVNQDGIVNLKQGTSSGAMMRFAWRSPSLSRRPTDLPVGAAFQGTCGYQYIINEMGITSMMVKNTECNEPTVPRPRCTVPQALAKAETYGAPKPPYLADISYYPVDDVARWYVRIASFSRFVPDDC